MTCPRDIGNLPARSDQRPPNAGAPSCDETDRLSTLPKAPEIFGTSRVSPVQGGAFSGTLPLSVDLQKGGAPRLGTNHFAKTNFVKGCEMNVTRDPPHAAKAIVEAYPERSMVLDPLGAASCVSDDVTQAFTRRRRFSSPTDSTAFSAKRYAWVLDQTKNTPSANSKFATMLLSALRTRIESRSPSS